LQRVSLGFIVANARANRSKYIMEMELPDFDNSPAMVAFFVEMDKRKHHYRDIRLRRISGRSPVVELVNVLKASILWCGGLENVHDGGFRESPVVEHIQHGVRCDSLR